MIKIKNEISMDFWIPSHLHRLCVSGVNPHTVKERVDTKKLKKKRDEKTEKYFQECILPRLRKQIIPHSNDEKYLRGKIAYGAGFRDLVNNALHQIYKNQRGYVLSKEQLIEVLKFVPDAKVIYSGGIYFIWKER